MAKMALPPHVEVEPAHIAAELADDLGRCPPRRLAVVQAGRDQAFPDREAFATKVPYLHYIVDGAIVVRSAGRELVAGVGDAILFLPGSLTLLAPRGHRRLWRVTWDSDLCVIGCETYLPGRRPEIELRACVTSGPAEPVVDGLVAACEAGAETGWLDLECGFAAALLASACRRCRNHRGGPTQHPGRLSYALAYIERNCWRDLSRQRTADAIGVHPNHLSRLLTRDGGAGFAQRLREARIRLAQRLLADPDLTVAMVAERSGFRDPSYFSQVFKRELGCSPSQWRESQPR